MTEGGFERWRVTSGAAGLAVCTRSGVDGTVFDIEIGSGDAARTLTATILSCSEDTCVVSIEGDVYGGSTRAAGKRISRDGRRGVLDRDNRCSGKRGLA